MSEPSTEPDEVAATLIGKRSVPDTPTELGGGFIVRGRQAIGEGIQHEFLRDRAAALTCCGLLAIFPGLSS